MRKHHDRFVERRKRVHQAPLFSPSHPVAELEAMHTLLDLGERLLAAGGLQNALDEILDAALDMLGSFMGYVRLYQEKTGMFELAAQRGVCSELLDYFRASGTDESTLCESAVLHRRRAVVDDVQADPAFSEMHRKIAAAAGYRALQATPIVGSDDRPLAILCTHFRRPHRPAPRELRILDLYLHQAAALIGRILAERALHDSEARFLSLAEASPAPIWQLAPDGNAVYVNGCFQDLAGKRPHELMQSNWHAIIHPDDTSEYLAALRLAQSERSRFQRRVRVKCRSGCWRLLESYAMPWFGAAGEYAGHVGISIDITDAVQSEQAQTTYRMATEGGNEGFYILRPMHDKNKAIADFEFIESNHCGAIYLGHRREELIGKRLSDLYYDIGKLDTPMKILRQAMKMGFYENDVEIARDAPLKLRWIHCKIVRFHGDLAIMLRDISAFKEHVAELERRGNEDALTSLPNRYWVQNYLPGAIERATTNASEMALLFMDLDGFKQVNDSTGHPAGDELLRTAARRLQVAVRPQDHVARLGGDEFVIVLENLAQRSDAAHVAERILHAFNENFTLSRGTHSIGASIGISVFPTDAKDAETMLRHADMAMYAVKSSGKRNYRFFEPGLAEAVHDRPANSPS